MEEYTFLPVKKIFTNQLQLRQLDVDDVNEVLQLRSDKEVMKYIPRPLLNNKEEAIEHIQMINSKIESREAINWAITLKNENKLIGIIGLYRIKWEHYRAEIGYMLLPQHQNKGIITEAIQAVVEYGFKDMNLHSIEAILDPKNIPSAKVLEKNNFILEGHFKENEFYNGVFLDSLVYSLLNKK